TRSTRDWSSDVCSSDLEVRLNGNLVYSTAGANLGTTAAASLQIGNETAAQTFTVVADNIAAQTSNSGPLVNTSPPTISGSDQQRSEERRVGKEGRCVWW